MSPLHLVTQSTVARILPVAFDCHRPLHAASEARPALLALVPGMQRLCADKGSVCGLAPPLSETESVPELKLPATDSSQVTPIVQDCPAPKLVGQLFVSEKSPEIAILLMSRLVLPMLVSIAVPEVWQLQCPPRKMGPGEQPNPRLLGVSATSVLEPLRATACGLLGASSVTERVPLRLPTELGAKVTLIVHPAPAATLDPQSSASVKFVVAAMLESVRVAVP